MPDTRGTDALLERYLADGYVVVPDVLSPAALREVRDALAALLRRSPTGRNGFEGEKTQRIYTLAARGAPFERMVLDPTVMALVSRLLLPHFLLTASQAIAIAPGETPQPIHYDDAFYTIARP